MKAITYNGDGNHSVKELESICKNQELLLNDKQVDIQKIKKELIKSRNDIDELVKALDSIINGNYIGILTRKHTIELIQKHTKK